ncbi:unnamed protein product [Cuscuta epithymum]|uniref:Uncharacterized protein n=1 Tax=Cuscuta epithymum TaxID=186058 RepID=A0AAV0G8Z3_9ASTE|nr:unnamed protein product [Cuscuta epithymum]
MGLGALGPEFLRTGSLKAKSCAPTESDPDKESIKEELKTLRKEVKELREQGAMQAYMGGPWMNPFLYHGYGQSTSGSQPQMPPMNHFPPQNHYNFPQQGSSAQQNTFNFSHQVPPMIPSSFGGIPQASSSQPPPYYLTMFPGFNGQGQSSMQPTTQPMQFMPIPTSNNNTQDENASFIDNLLGSGGNNNANEEQQ